MNSQKSITYLRVPFSEKELAKALGAKWDATRKQWFVPAQIAIEQFAKWIPKLITLNSPIYIIECPYGCWKCDRTSTVVTLAGYFQYPPQYEECDKNSLVLLADIKALPHEIEDLMRKFYPQYFRDFSKTVGDSYFMNHCQCGAKFGDFYLFDYDEGGAFCFYEEKDCARVALIELKGIKSLKIEAGIGDSTLYNKLPKLAKVKEITLHNNESKV